MIYASFMFFTLRSDCVCTSYSFVIMLIPLHEPSHTLVLYVVDSSALPSRGDSKLWQMRAVSYSEYQKPRNAQVHTI